VTGAPLPNCDPSASAVTLTILGLVAVDNTGLNVVCNQEYAQVVPHVCLNSLYSPIPNLIARKVHYHIIPAPRAQLITD
jgi:hypothetical protein